LARNELAKLCDSIWESLGQAVGAKQNSLRSFVLATLSAHTPSVRTVVLRAVDRTRQTVYCCSDARSAKIIEIEQNDAVSTLFYDAKKKTQIRIFGRAAIHGNDDVAHEIWRTIPLSGRALIAADTAPGTILSGQTPVSEKFRALLDGRVMYDEPVSNFVPIEVIAETIDYLDIRIGRHKRALISVPDPQKSSWIQP